MIRPQGARARLGGVLLAVAAAFALLALPGLASGHDHHHGPPADAGTIESFDGESGVLTVALTDGGTVSGLVTPRTHIQCGRDRGHRHGRRHARRHGRRHSLRHRHGAARASRRGELGGDRGRGPEGEEGQGRQPGEDPPGHDGTAPGRSEGPGQGVEHSGRCTTEDLVAGTPVKVAELVLIDGNAYYRLVGLPPKSPQSEPEGEGEEDGEEGPPES